LYQTIAALFLSHPDLRAIEDRNVAAHLQLLSALNHGDFAAVSLAVGGVENLAAVRQALATARHLLEMYRRQLTDDKARRRLQRLDRRLLDVAQQLPKIAAGEKK
jgi:hypothetical protein